MRLWMLVMERGFTWLAIEMIMNMKRNDLRTINSTACMVSVLHMLNNNFVIHYYLYWRLNVKVEVVLGSGSQVCLSNKSMYIDNDMQLFILYIYMYIQIYIYYGYSRNNVFFFTYHLQELLDREVFSHVDCLPLFDSKWQPSVHEAGEAYHWKTQFFRNTLCLIFIINSNYS